MVSDMFAMAFIFLTTMFVVALFSIFGSFFTGIFFWLGWNFAVVPFSGFLPGLNFLTCWAIAWCVSVLQVRPKTKEDTTPRRRR